MKKLMVMLATAAAALGLSAATYGGAERYTVPDEFNEGPTNIVGYTDDALTTWPGSPMVYWFANNFPTNANEVQDYEQPVEVKTENKDATDAFKYLAFETDTTAPLLRTFNNVTKEDAGKFTLTPQTINSTLGLFVDTKVKFSASEEAPQNFDGKIALWLQAIPEEKDNDGNIVVDGSTNLMVTCGQLNSDYGKDGLTNIVIAADDVTVTPDTWYQVTIRTIDTIATGKTIPGFVIYINGKLATAQTAYDLPTLTGKATESQFAGAVFASAGDSSDATAQTLESVGFAGNGGVQTVALTDMEDAPLFAQDPTYVTLVWDANVSAITIGGENVIEGKTSPLKIQVKDFQASVEATVTIDPLYKATAIDGVNFTEFSSVLKKGEASFTYKPDQNFGDSQTVTIATVLDRQGAQLFKKNTSGDFVALGEPLPWFVDVTADIAKKVEAETLRIAEYDEESRTFTYEGDTIKIVLMEDETNNNFNANWSATPLNIIIDLNGHKLVAGDEYAVDETWDSVIIVNGYNMTIMDSVGGGEIVGISGENGVDAICNTYALTIEAAANATNPSKFTGNVLVGDGSTTTILGGMFTDKPSGDGTVTLGTEADPLKWSETQTEGFWTLVPDVPPTGTVIIITEGGSVTNGPYETIAEAVTNAVNGDTITLLADQTLTEEVQILDKEVTLAGAFTVSTAVGKAFNVRHGATLTIAAETTVIASGEDTTIFVWPYEGDKNTMTADNSKMAKLVVNGTVKYTGNDDWAAITTHGNDSLATSEGVEIVIAGTVTSTDAALYLPGKGTCKVNDGAYIEGIWAGIQMKSGALTVNGGTIKCTGADSTPTTQFNNGAYPSGCAIQMEGNTGYAGGMTLTVNGGTIESVNAKAVYAYGVESQLTSIAINRGLLKGATDVFQFDWTRKVVPGTSTATFNKDVSAYCADGFETVLDEQSGLYKVDAIPQFDVTFTKDSTEIPDSAKKFYRDYVLAAGDIPEITDEGAWDVNPTNAVITCTTNFNFTVKAEEPDVPVDDPTALNEDGKKNAAAVAEAITRADGDVNEWVATVYGENGTIPAAKLNAAPAANIAIAVANDLPITIEEPKFDVEASTVSEGNVAAFEFTLKDGTTPEQIKAITDKVKAMVRYTSNLATVPFDQATDAQVDIKASPVEGKIKAELKKTAANAGFMKVEPQPAN